MNIEDMRKAQEKLVGAVLDLDSAIEDMKPDDPVREQTEGYQRTIQGLVGDLAIQIARSDREETT